MFSQRNNPYCELVQNCETNIVKKMKRNDFLKLVGLGGGSFMINGIGLNSNDLLYQLEEITVYDNYIRGSNFYKNEIELLKMNTNTPIELFREPDNIHDSFAIAVVCQNRKIGYIPAFENIVLANMMDKGVQLNAQISSINPEGLRYGMDYMAVKITTKLLVKQDHILSKDLTQNRADEAVDLYRKGVE